METLKPILFVFSSLVLLPIVILWIHDRLVYCKPTKEEQEAHARKFKERLLNPDFEAVEYHFRHALPQPVRDLHGNEQEVLRENFLVSPTLETPEDNAWLVAFYKPCDAESVRQSWPGCEQYFCFANDGLGNNYIIDPSQANPAVLFYDHEGGEITKVCDSLLEFMGWPRREPKEWVPNRSLDSDAKNTMCFRASKLQR